MAYILTNKTENEFWGKGRKMTTDIKKAMQYKSYNLAMVARERISLVRTGKLILKAK